MLRRKGQNKEEHNKEKVKEELLGEMEKELEKDIVPGSGMSSPGMDPGVPQEELMGAYSVPPANLDQNTVLHGDLRSEE